MRRLFWFCLGACTALFVTSWTKKKAAEVAEKMTPENVARSVGAHAVSAARRAGEFASQTWKAFRASKDETVVQSPNP